MNGHVLIVDDDEAMLEMLRTDLGLRGLSVRCCRSAEEALEVAVQESFDTVLTDLNLSGMSGIELCKRMAGLQGAIPVVVITGFGSLDSAVSAIRAGAYDFVTKPVELDLLYLVLERAVRHRQLREQVRLLETRLQETRGFRQLVGESPPMRELFDRIRRIADTDASVLITGESGSGKELVARALHDCSARNAGPFVAVNCAALPEALLESELFGHAQGAFTDAKRDRKGLFEEANGGTLLLDEIGDFPIGLQAKLLRVLEERCVRPVGESKSIPIDLRVIAATHRDLEAQVDAGQFRQDLFFRINVIQLEVPPLRERQGDILLLAEHYLAEISGRCGKCVSRFSPPFAERLLDYAWPGNVRELRNAIERAVTLARFNELMLDDLPSRIRDYRATNIPFLGDDIGSLPTIEELQKRYILHVLQRAGGNKSKAARILGLDRTTMYRKLEQYGVSESIPSA